jgi:hypothetical protein
MRTNRGVTLFTLEERLASGKLARHQSLTADVLVVSSKFR